MIGREILKIKKWIDKKKKKKKKNSKTIFGS